MSSLLLLYVCIGSQKENFLFILAKWSIFLLTGKFDAGIDHELIE